MVSTAYTSCCDYDNETHTHSLRYVLAVATETGVGSALLAAGSGTASVDDAKAKSNNDVNQRHMSTGDIGWEANLRYATPKVPRDVW